jgi:hypothetical protein
MAKKDRKKSDTEESVDADTEESVDTDTEESVDTDTEVKAVINQDRKFRLYSIPKNMAASIGVGGSRYTVGKYKFFQKNVYAQTHDPDKENILEVDGKTARILEKNERFQEVK